MPAYIAKLTHEQRRDRQIVLAERVDSGATLTDVAIEYGVTVSLVSSACKRLGITVKRGRPLGHVDTNALVKREAWNALDWSKRDTDLGIELGISRERVRQVRKILKRPKAEHHRSTTTGIQLREWLEANREKIEGLTANDVREMTPEKTNAGCIAREMKKLGIRMGQASKLTTENLHEFVTVAGEKNCWEWNRVGSSAYPQIKSRYLHHVVFELFNGPRPAGKWVLHSCDNKQCVNPNHLYAGTAKDNAMDRVRNGHGRGDKPVLTAEQRSEMKVLRLVSGWTLTRLSRRFDVSIVTVMNILKSDSQQLVAQ